MNGETINFQRMKEIPIGRVLARYGVKLRSSGGEMRGQCPLPAHTSQESRNSFSVNLGRNIWCCQSMSCADARGGQLGGTVLDFVAQMERCSIREAAGQLAEWFGGMESAAPTVEQKPRPVSEPNLPTEVSTDEISIMRIATSKNVGSLRPRPGVWVSDTMPVRGSCRDVS